ncbi:hypothetical protein GRZ55_11370 [Chelativorans sp. ZYF759]|uniref:hypothetical protein n=1 Tax=Chelativorans sp. ZYF759 TaxID=2692213 RepID=UPI00145ED384|nr:hypothetical protein [Chelativorans sp. ZYF759]NMG39844.1 hypothetical protein [Chelativorans sp. ZYF759]
MALHSGTLVPPAPRKKAAAEAVPSFRPDGSVLDLAKLRLDDIVWPEIAAGLSKIARFNARPSGPAFSVSQHCVMGADAVFSETGDPVAAGYFLLHDAHEALLGDVPRPTADLIGRLLGARGRQRLASAIHTAKLAIDRVIYTRAGLAPPDRVPGYQAIVRNMDERMLRAEALALFGPRAGEHVGAGDLPPPKLTGAIRAWGAMRAEEAWLTRLDRYLGIAERLS